MSAPNAARDPRASGEWIIDVGPPPMTSSRDPPDAPRIPPSSAIAATAASRAAFSSSAAHRRRLRHAEQRRVRAERRGQYHDCRLAALLAEPGLRVE